MNILYINHYAGSPDMGMEFRPFYLSQEWSKMGHKVTIIAADYSHLRKKNPKVDRDFYIEFIEGIEYVWIKTGKYKSNGVKRALTMGRFVRTLFLHSKMIAEKWRPNVVIASSTYPLDAYPAKRIAKMAGAKYVHEVHDMWPITPIELYGMSRNHPFVKIMQCAEDYFCTHADKVVSILPCANAYFVNHGMDERKFIYVANGVKVSDWEFPEELPAEYVDVIKRARREKRLVLTFFGSHTKSYALDYLLKALAKVNQSKIFVLFVGSGTYKDYLITLAKELNIDKDAYSFLPPINKNAIPSLIQACDASYVGAIKNRMFEFGIGMNKLFDAMMGGKPLLYAVNAPNDFAKQYDCGISVQAEDVLALKMGIETLLSMDEDTRKQMGDNGHKAILENFTFPVLAKKFLDGIS